MRPSVLTIVNWKTNFRTQSMTSKNVHNLCGQRKIDVLGQKKEKSTAVPNEDLHDFIKTLVRRWMKISPHVAVYVLPQKGKY